VLIDLVPNNTDTHKRNLIANYLGQGWSAVIGLAFIPLYIHYLGMEAYGLIGLFAMLQAGLAFLDMGLTPTLTREMARFTAGVHSSQYVGVLLRSAEVISFCLATAIGLLAWAGSDYIASDWLKADKLPAAAVVEAISIMAIVVALRFCEGIYRGSLFGLQQQVWFNVANVILATLRHAGAAVILIFVSSTIQAFFYWQAIISLCSVFVLAVHVHKIMPKPILPVRFSLRVVKDIWPFAAGMMGISLLSIILTQVDKVILSRALPLDYFGFYTLAGTLAGTFYLIIIPITQAFYPRMVEFVSRNDNSNLINIYHVGTQIVVVLSLPIVFLFCFYGRNIIFIWSGNEILAKNVAPILIPLALGTFLNGLMHMPYQLQLAHGWTNFTIKINLIGISILIPGILWIVPIYGAVGAAWIWTVLNTGYVFIAINFMHKRLLPTEKWCWYREDVCWPLIGATGIFFLLRRLSPDIYENRLSWLIFLIMLGGSIAIAAIFMSGQLRSRIRGAVVNLYLRRFKST
jgi:O-antigen/teichoic acid export membrane protein